MQDYTWPSVFFSYFFFTISLGVAVFFCVRSMKDGYWGREGEEIKFRVFEEEDFHRRDAETLSNSESEDIRVPREQRAQSVGVE